VLLVEDDAAVREAAARALGSGGYRVIAAAGAADALEALKAEAHPPAMLVTDVVMPDTTGRELADQLRREQPGLRVLFLSGYAQDLIGHHGVLDPTESFLAKPFTATSLLSTVRKVLDSG
jgi:CheY-like chemotaxis protein